jgi:hypothetical protein
VLIRVVEEVQPAFDRKEVISSLQLAQAKLGQEGERLAIPYRPFNFR